MKKLALFLVVSLVILSCKKEACEENNYGEVCFKNNKSEQVSISLDGTLLDPNWKVIDAGDTYCYTNISSGAHSYATLSTGGVSLDDTFDLVSCDSKEIPID